MVKSRQSASSLSGEPLLVVGDVERIGHKNFCHSDLQAFLPIQTLDGLSFNVFGKYPDILGIRSGSRVGGQVVAPFFDEMAEYFAGGIPDLDVRFHEDRIPRPGQHFIFARNVEVDNLGRINFKDLVHGALHLGLSDVAEAKEKQCDDKKG